MTVGALSVTAAEGPSTAAKPSSNVFWPAAPDEPRVQFVTAISATSDITGKPIDPSTAVYGAAAPQDVDASFPIRPFGIRMSKGKIYVCDPTGGGVYVLDVKNKTTSVFKGSADKPINKPIDIALAEDGSLLVADTGLGSVAVFDKDRKFVATLGEKIRPTALALHGGKVFVGDVRGGLRTYDAKTHKPLAVAEEGRPIVGVAVDTDGAVYSVDVTKCEVHRTSADGKTNLTFGGLADKPGSFVRPKHMALSSDGTLAIVDNAFRNIQLFDSKGKLLMSFGGAGDASRPGSLDMPCGITITEDPDDLALFAQKVHPAFAAQALILVSNNIGSAKISVFVLGRLKKGKTVDSLESPSELHLPPK